MEKGKEKGEKKEKKERRERKEENRNETQKRKKTNPKKSKKKNAGRNKYETRVEKWNALFRAINGMRKKGNEIWAEKKKGETCFFFSFFFLCLFLYHWGENFAKTERKGSATNAQNKLRVTNEAQKKNE